MLKNNFKNCSGLLNKCLLDFCVLENLYLVLLILPPGHVKCILLDNQQLMTQPALINLHPTEYMKGLR